MGCCRRQSRLLPLRRTHHLCYAWHSEMDGLLFSLHCHYFFNAPKSLEGLLRIWQHDFAVLGSRVLNLNHSFGMPTAMGNHLRDLLLFGLLCCFFCLSDICQTHNGPSQFWVCFRRPKIKKVVLAGEGTLLTDWVHISSAVLTPLGEVDCHPGKCNKRIPTNCADYSGQSLHWSDWTKT